MKKLYIPILVLMVVGLGAANLPGAIIDVSIQNNFFSPANITIDVGDTVRWTHQGSVIHTTTSGSPCSPNGIWNSGNMTNGDVFTHTFNTAGTFPYFCIPHCLLGMTGSVTVVQAALQIPTGQDIFTQIATDTPERGETYVQSMPIGIGDIANMGDIVHIVLDVGFADRVDAYLLLFAPDLFPDDFFVVGEDDMVELLSIGGLVPWRPGRINIVNADPFGAIPVSLFPPGTYQVIFGITPEGDVGFNSYAAWITGFTIE